MRPEVTTLLLSSMTCVCVVSCRRADRTDVVGADPQATVAPSSSAPRCPELRIDPWNSDDYPSATNSDGTPKRFPPGPPNVPGYALVLHYDDFGPQAMAGQLIGAAWWSWEGGGSFEPGDDFDVRVVVYRNRTREQIEARYPTVVGKSDYRLVPRDKALLFLDDQIAQLDEWMAEEETGASSFTQLRADLDAVRRTILECLP